MTNPTPRQHETGCKHFNGLQNDECRAGIAYASMRYPYPCLPRDDGQYHATCPLFEYHTEAELEARDKATGEAVTRFVQALVDNRCPHCGEKIAEKEQVGRCVYARPCGCRLYQGKLKEGED